MVSEVSKAMAGKTARPCDSCVRKRARWYCAADDAFLCQSCDGSVHSANDLAGRHERVRLTTASVELPWTTGFTKKARTPRGKAKSEDRVDDRVPELGGDEYDEVSEEQNVMYRVPFINVNGENLMEFDDFSGDVESLLGFDIEELEFMNYDEGWMEGKRVKMEKEEDEMKMDVFVNNDGDPLMVVKESSEEFEGGEMKKNVLLELDYEGVIAAWADHRSPWSTGDPPEFHKNHSWPDLGSNGGTIYHTYGDTINGRTYDGAREARVSRYREKRRNRLFSKKIRYEVRKLNAEKRPRMKGRFVKRSVFAPPSALTLLNK